MGMIINLHSYLMTDGYPIFSSDLNKYSWQAIKAYIKTGLTRDAWPVGSTKTDTNYTCTLIGYDIDGANTATFSIGLAMNNASIALSSYSASTRRFFSEVDFIDTPYYDAIYASNGPWNKLSNDLKSCLERIPVLYSRSYKSSSQTWQSVNMQLFPPGRDDFRLYPYYRTYGLLVENAWTRDSYSISSSGTSSSEDASQSVNFYYIGSGTTYTTSNGYTDNWSSSHSDWNYRTGTTTANLELLFVI